MVNKIYIVDDDLNCIAGLELLLKSVQYRVTAFSNPVEFLAQVDALEYGCILLDIRMPKISGMEVLKVLGTKQNRFPVIMMTAFGNIPMAVQAIKLGAYDFLTKPFNEQELIDKIQKAFSKRVGKLYNDDEIEIIFFLYKKLTSREKQIMPMVINGKMNKQISADLGISISTVEMHRKNIMLKMDSNNMTDLIRKGLLLEA